LYKRLRPYLYFCTGQPGRRTWRCRGSGREGQPRGELGAGAGAASKLVYAWSFKKKSFKKKKALSYWCMSP
jgi:hypothetical protein